MKNIRQPYSKSPYYGRKPFYMTTTNKTYEEKVARWIRRDLYVIFALGFVIGVAAMFVTFKFFIL